jgi:hypothetical protein
MSSSAAIPVTSTHPAVAGQCISTGEEGEGQPGGVWETGSGRQQQIPHQWCDRCTSGAGIHSSGSDTAKSSSEKIREEKKKLRADRTPSQRKEGAVPEGYSETVAELHRLHKEATGAAYVFSAKDGSHIKRLLEAIGRDELLARLRTYYTGQHWFTRDGRSFGGFVAHVNDLAGPGGNGHERTAEQEAAALFGRGR